MRDGVKAPLQLAGAHVVRANIAARSGIGLRRTKAQDEVVAVEHAWGGQRDRVLRVVGVQILAQVQPAALAEAVDQLARGGIERVQEVHDIGEQARLRSIEPVGEAAAGLLPHNAGVEPPQLFASGCIQRKDLECGRVAEQRSSCDQRIGLHAAFAARLKAPHLA